MNFTSKVALTTFTVFFLGTGIQCCNNDEDIEFYRVMDIRIVNGNNAEADLVGVNEGDEVLGSAYAIIVSPDVVQLAEAPQAGWGNYAQAGACRPPMEEALIERYEDISVVTLNDFNADNPAGSDISHLFRGRPYHDNRIAFNTLSGLTGLLNRQGPSEWQRNFILYLFEAPEPGNEHQFEVTVQLGDGIVFNQVTETVILN